MPSLESLFSLGLERGNPGSAGNFAGMSRTPGGVPKVCAKTRLRSFSVPNLVGPPNFRAKNQKRIHRKVLRERRENIRGSAR